MESSVAFPEKEHRNVIMRFCRKPSGIVVGLRTQGAQFQQATWEEFEVTCDGSLLHVLSMVP